VHTLIPACRGGRLIDKNLNQSPSPRASALAAARPTAAMPPPHAVPQPRPSPLPQSQCPSTSPFHIEIGPVAYHLHHVYPALHHDLLFKAPRPRPPRPTTHHNPSYTRHHPLLTAGVAAAVVVFVLLLAAEQTSVEAAPDAGQAYRDVSHVRR